MTEIVLDAFIDCLKLIPFLFATYLILEFIERQTEDKIAGLVRRAGAWGPFVGALLGLFPQCGFSASAANFFALRIISSGTLLAVFLSTSDEMIPVLLAESAGVGLIARILAVKFAAGVCIGLAADRVFHLCGDSAAPVDIHSMCERDHCNCDEDGVLLSSVKHTLRIAVFIFVISLILNTIIECIGHEALRSVILDKPVAGPLLASLVGLIPNCAASVIITELYLSGAMSAGSMLAGLLAASGIGLLVLFRVNRDRMGDNVKLLAFLYCSSVVIGAAFDLLGLTL